MMADSVDATTVPVEVPIICNKTDINSNNKTTENEPHLKVFSKEETVLVNGDIEKNHSDSSLLQKPPSSEESQSASPVKSTPSTNINGKSVNGIKSATKNSKTNLHGNSLPLTADTWTVTSDTPIWLECCQNSFRARGNNARNFQPHTKLGNSHSPNHLYPLGQGNTSSCSQTLHNNASNSGSCNRNGNQYFVDLHVNPGETFYFDNGDHVQLFQGPATVRMVSSNNTPPVPMPVQVPPGHMVQQIVDEHGTLRHIILSPQPPVPVSVDNPYNGSQSSGGSSAPFYLYPPPSYPITPQFPPHMQPLHQSNHHPVGAGAPDCTSYSTSYRDERTQRQFFKLKKRLEARQKDGPSPYTARGTKTEFYGR